MVLSTKDTGNDNTRRPRYRFQNNNTMLGNSHRSMAREAARVNHAAVPSILPSSRVIDLAGMLEDIGLDDDESSLPKPRRTTTTTTPTALDAFPRYLRRPAYRSVSIDAITAVAPELANVSVEFIQKRIRETGNILFVSKKGTQINCPKGRLPRQLAVDVSTSSNLPTHLIAAYSQPNALKKQRISIHAVHALVIVANCANLPPLPYSRPEIPCRYPDGGTISLPVIPLAIPNPEAFPTLLEYLYTQRTDLLLRFLLPVSVAPNTPLDLDESLAKHLGEMCSSMDLRIRLQRVYAFYTTVTALGVFDEKLWKLMEASWEILHVALACA